MSQCVPSWGLDDNPTSSSRLNFRSHSNSIAPDVPMLDYEVAELTWENGHLAMHGLGQPRAAIRQLPTSTLTKYAWPEKPRAGGTLESIVNQATRFPIPAKHSAFDGGGGGEGDELVPWFNHHQRSVPATTASASATMTMDALVPCSNRSDDPRLGTCVVGCSTHVGSCSVAPRQDDEATAALPAEKRPRVALVSTAHEWSSKDQSVSGSATTFGRDSHSQHVTVDTFDKDMGMGFTSTSMGSPENTSSGRPGTKETTTGDDHDSVCHSRAKRQGGNEEHKKKGNGKSSVSTKRSRAAAIHNQSERKRRDKINQRMKTLQKLVPNSSKTDKASMLDEVIEYLKQLQAQVHMMSRMNMPPMMLPMSLQQQLQMSMMAPLGMGMGMSMGMGMGMDMNTMGRPNIPGISPVLHPTAFMALNSWDSSGDRLSAPAAAMMPDPMSTFLACQSQPMTMDAYSRMAALYQQLHQPPTSSSKS